MPEDASAALEWDDHQDSLCGGCGTPRGDGFDVAQERAWTATPLVCHACAAKDRKAEAWRSDERASMAGVYFAVSKDDDEGGE